MYSDLISSCQVQTHPEVYVDVKANPRTHIYERNLRILEQGLLRRSQIAPGEKESVGGLVQDLRAIMKNSEKSLKIF